MSKWENARSFVELAFAINEHLPGYVDAYFGPEEIKEVISIMSAANLNVPLIAKSNAGLPYMDGDIVKFDGTPEVMANYALEAKEAGALLIGGCCGTTPKHIKAMAESLKGTQ